MCATKEENSIDAHNLKHTLNYKNKIICVCYMIKLAKSKVYPCLLTSLVIYLAVVIVQLSIQS